MTVLLIKTGMTIDEGRQRGQIKEGNSKGAEYHNETIGK
jgi:hypothetical protein